MPRQAVITTDRLVLRPFTSSDGDDVRRLAGIFEIADTTAEIPHPYPDGAFEEWFASHAEQARRREAFHWAITRRETGELIGAISLMKLDHRARLAETGYWVAKDHWGHGFCTEAARAVIDHAFDVLNLNRVHAHHMVRNPASGAVLRKIGMRYEGRRRQHLERWGKLEDIELFGILAEDRPATTR